ncbi:arsenate reductase ArsC [Nocardioides sp. NPDC057772]|uniref:arsenate reductase ArsC n=1 Tax=Nocardioides sp. NPDC057772 TaxID=3346245 RepID=UPI00366F4D1F
MSTYEHLEIDQQLALREAHSRLAREFNDTATDETIRTFLLSSYEQFIPRASFADYVPLLAERHTRQQLQALHKIEHGNEDHKPVVLFVCVHNAGRSQMALGFLSHHAGTGALGWSAGSQPADLVNPVAIEAMAERGIDISEEFPKPWTDEIVQAADVVVTMGCGDECPYFPGKTYVDWALDDPKGLGIEAVRPIRDEVEQRVLDLLRQLGVSTVS